MKPETLPDTASTAAIAELLGVTPRQARNVLSGAGIKPVARGSWPLAAAIQGVLIAARQDKGISEVARARARAINAKAYETEMRVAERERALVSIEDANAALDILAGTVLEELGGLPARITRDMELRRQIDDEIQASQLRIAGALNTQANALQREIEEENDE